MSSDRSASTSAVLHCGVIKRGIIKQKKQQTHMEQIYTNLHRRGGGRVAEGELKTQRDANTRVGASLRRSGHPKPPSFPLSIAVQRYPWRVRGVGVRQAQQCATRWPASLARRREPTIQLRLEAITPSVPCSAGLKGQSRTTARLQCTQSGQCRSRKVFPMCSTGKEHAKQTIGT
ncbi:hypothetical protein ZHAS_00014435 [Anopheles sinensis]|uniref:Uncharacterized protein n=1 Tax=Anopheles sinensis TaxID=74873 RepID=A0A084W891_ANOSI|nr:hypothetical protein ZHAS_00014435 [Anopheles sinensis]